MAPPQSMTPSLEDQYYQEPLSPDNASLRRIKDTLDYEIDVSVIYTNLLLLIEMLITKNKNMCHTINPETVLNILINFTKRIYSSYEALKKFLPLIYNLISIILKTFILSISPYMILDSVEELIILIVDGHINKELLEIINYIIGFIRTFENYHIKTFCDHVNKHQLLYRLQVICENESFNCNILETTLSIIDSIECYSL